MVRIRLRRVGGKNQPSFRIVAADRESPRDGRFLEILGFYNPRTEPATIKVDEARVFDWLSKGAQPSDSVVRIFKSNGTWDRWERYKAGESPDKLAEEAQSGLVEVDPRTRRDDLAETRAGKKKSKKAAEPEKAAPEPKEAEAPEASAETDEAEVVVEDEASVSEGEPTEEAAQAEEASAEETETPEVEKEESGEDKDPAETESSSDAEASMDAKSDSDAESASTEDEEVTSEADETVESDEASEGDAEEADEG